MQPTSRSFGNEHGDLAQCIHLSSCIHWVMELLCTFQAMESQVPCSAYRHWPASPLKSSQKASCTQPTSWAAGEEKGWGKKGLEPQLSSPSTGTGGNWVEREGLVQGASKLCPEKGVSVPEVAWRRVKMAVLLWGKKINERK